MRRRLRLLPILLCTVLAPLAAVSCGPTESPEQEPDPETLLGESLECVQNSGSLESTDSKDGFNKGLFYRNELSLDMGDPAVVYDNGVFYAAGTRGGTSFEIFRSENLTDWKKVEGGGFFPSVRSWSKKNLWAPDIQKIGDKWYMYYTAQYDCNNLICSEKDSHCQMGIAVSDKPYGPYTQWTGTNALGKDIGLGDPALDGLEEITVLDPNVFQDDDGQLYMFFSYDPQYDKPSVPKSGLSEIYGCKMLDPYTWDLSTLKRLIVAGRHTPDGEEGEVPWEVWVKAARLTEGPYMLKHDGKYFLTYSANGLSDVEYAVGYAYSDSPLGDYVKPDDNYLQNMLCGVPGESGTFVNTRYHGFMTGTGHASIVDVDGEYLLAYHAHMNRDKWGALEDIYPGKTQYRALGFDYIYFDDATGLPYMNGPTYSLQRLPKALSGYSNIASQATVTVDGKPHELSKYVIDNFTNRAVKTAEVDRELQFTEGKHTVTLNFPSPVSIIAVNVYNSYDYDKRIDRLKSIGFGSAGHISGVDFNSGYINSAEKTSRREIDSWKSMYPHAAFNAELKSEVTTDTVSVTIEQTRAFAIGEIEILGKIIVKEAK